MIKKNYSEHFVSGNSIKLHYLDWGGDGQPLILIHGLGDSPYIFENLAESLKKDFRVIAYSKRGHCKSIATDTNYDNSSLVSDLKLLLDSLDIPKADLLGWSMGGNEISEFAIQYPDRTNKLIYFEAGYDLSEEPFNIILNNLPKDFFPKSSDLVSIDAYRKWYHHFWFADMDWNPTLEANLQASIHINPDKSISTLPNEEITRATLQSAMSYQRNYDKILAPALIFFTNSFFHPPNNDPEVVSIYDNLEKEIINPWRQSSINRINSEFKNASIKYISRGTHTSLIFLSKDEIVKDISNFLLE